MLEGRRRLWNAAGWQVYRTVDMRLVSGLLNLLRSVLLMMVDVVRKKGTDLRGSLYLYFLGIGDDCGARPVCD